MSYSPYRFNYTGHQPKLKYGVKWGINAASASQMCDLQQLCIFLGEKKEQGKPCSLEII
ncbi:MAG: hypothetical protein HRU29_06030 [Rhizobiales bacterium]|nr:hypothetical protein [Hyphomicrobiales bacterium]NRB13944.1 hypothetical protein [Hyphomicrobiales bacterium]